MNDFRVDRTVYICKLNEIPLAGIYIHIPFCKQACHYCDFHFSTQLGGIEAMVEAICLELELRKEYLGTEVIQTVYFGGGSPSLLPTRMIDQILTKISQNYSNSWQEVTLEANPDDLSEDKLSDWKSMGIDRLSLGIQSFQPEVLQFYNRAHTAQESLLAIEKARRANFTKFNLDLIYGFPSENHSIWEKDLSLALELDPGHLSCYALTIEPHTAFGNWVQKGKFTPAEEDFVADQFDHLLRATALAGYVQYEISNFAKSESFSLHNSNYWRHVPYLGIGPSAHSFDGKNRGANVSNNVQYIRALRSAQVAFQEENLSKSDQINEYLLTSLRTLWGADLDYLRDRYQYDLRKLKKNTLEKMDSEGWLIWQQNKLSLTAKGKLLADSIAFSLFTD
ncbi:radical SAM family heme chaperone HemW [Algoriphagus namhaensis]